jgi:broad specificity phosphatase PhoE
MQNKVTEVILVTHGLTEWNKQNRYQGHVDTPLCEEGLHMAGCLARRLAGCSIQAIYSSDLCRAVQTARPLARMKALGINLDSRLREGRSREQQSSDEYPLLPFVPEVETEQDVLLRMQEVLQEIALQNQGSRVLVVSHGGAVQLFISKVLEMSAAENCFQNKRTAVNELICQDQSWFCKALDDDGHLK